MARRPVERSSLPEYIENPAQLGENVEPVHCPTVGYETIANAVAANEPLTELESRWEESNYFERLDGEWEFCWAETPTDLPEELPADSDWDTIPVPSVWQLHGYDRPIYRNHALTWERLPEVETLPDAPDVPSEFNPVGTYRRTVTVPEAWEGNRRSYLQFEGVKSACFVWIDGEYVGYDQGSMTPSEFDVTDHLDPGSDHELLVQVFRFSDGSYLETQDMIRFSGIFRSVFAYSKPERHVRDYTVRTDFDEALVDATLSVDADIRWPQTIEDEPELTLVGELYDPSGSLVTTMEAPAERGDGNSVRLEAEISDPEKWSAEDPTLYTLAIALRTAAGETTEALTQFVGFREYEIDDGVLTVNGNPVTIRGMNRHDHDPRGGRTVPFDRALEDLRAMKRNNINAIRTAHYPHDLSVYAIADELGLYVFDEANVETHFDLNFVNDHPEFHDAFLERFERMIAHHKNVTSIVAWSTSNEAGTGPAHEAMAEHARDVDETRFVFHQGDGEAPYEEFHDSMTGTAPFTDISGPRYPIPDTLAQFSSVDDRPLIMGEYAHAFCNSLGLQDAYWDLVNTIDGVQGGFIWEWTNQTLRADTVADGNTRSDGVWFDGDSFLLDGVVFSDLSAKPSLEQVKWTQRPMSVEPVTPRDGVVTITNGFDFTNLCEYELQWELAIDGVVDQRGIVDVDIPAGRTRGVILPFEEPSLDPGQECLVTVSLHLGSDTEWADRGHEIAFEQFEVPIRPSAKSSSDGEVERGALEVTELKEEILFASDQFEYRFDRTRGRFRDLSIRGQSVGQDGPIFDAYRAPVPNEGLVRTATEWGYNNGTEWTELGLDRLTHDVREVTLERGSSDHARLEVRTTVKNTQGDRLFDVAYGYGVHATGAIDVKVAVEPTETLRERLSSWLPRMGIDLELPAAITDVEWYGRGPHETYPDRKTGAKIGRYTGQIEDQFVPYRVPQDNGNKTDVRWAAMTGSEAGIIVSGDHPLNVRFDRYRNLDAAEYLGDLIPSDETTLSVDARVSGVGGTPVKPTEEHRIEPDPLSFSFVLRPYTPNTYSPELSGKGESGNGDNTPES
ncbi:glycoside hydrolase family 2 TIM barrel-domain containing protein [Halostagnicola sp. A-GB9-2]|uniref:glycoside hydrolase family 2 TIM barrel-domain containing protein n=1 Tax=Halostagnicola sp. A-GB9-2 TaxID=3048066 RepID=UPI0024BFE850|nr:glycoside hydrolase family 2 TIM barrel-domain containing protein [Halostagnicola sp. A-GB9-2]MDJ1433270.1 glycoside hydrolase family 2 TIM barrel-domain containing protein [Halostagnicola sp. A-GB9-2]